MYKLYNMGKTIKDKFKSYRESEQYNKLRKINKGRIKKIKFKDDFFEEEFPDENKYNEYDK